MEQTERWKINESNVIVFTKDDGTEREIALVFDTEIGLNLLQLLNEHEADYQARNSWLKNVLSN